MQKETPLMDIPQYYIFNFNLRNFEIKSLIGDVREFQVFHYMTITNMALSRAQSLGYEIYDNGQNKDYDIRIIVRGKIVGTIESIIQESAPGTSVVNLVTNSVTPLRLILT